VSIIEALFAAVDGTLLNAATILVGGVLGTLLGDRLPARMQETLFAAIGLVTVLIGLLGAETTHSVLVLLGAMLLGGMIGEVLGIEQGLQRLGDWLQKRLARPGATFSEGFVTASLLFCVGPLSILGALNNGLTGDTTDLALKATLDGIGALAFAAALGPGVLGAAATLLLYQGAISLGAHGIKPLVDANPAAIRELNAAGGLVLVAIGLKVLKLRELRVANFLPALVVAPLLVVATAYLPHLGR
jgi:uncharacterized membrane protein YqgA involved in biofilm formation